MQRGIEGPGELTRTPITPSTKEAAANGHEKAALSHSAFAETDARPGLEAEFITQVRERIQWTAELSDAELAAVAKEVARIIGQAGPHSANGAGRDLT